MLPQLNRTAFQEDAYRPACQPYAFQWLPLDVSTSMGVIGPKVNKFEQVSSDDHQDVSSGGCRTHVWYPSGGGGGGTHITWRPPQTECQIDTCENLIFVQLRLQEIITQKLPTDHRRLCLLICVVFPQMCFAENMTHGSGMNCAFACSKYR